MNKWFGRVVILVLLGLLVGLPIVIQPEKPTSPADELRLVIISPHNEQIRYETEQAFNRWHLEKFGQSVAISWRTQGGSSDIERILKSQYTQLAKSGNEDQGIGIDMVFGGGDYMFDHKLKPGVTVVDDRGQTRQVMLTMSITDDLGGAVIGDAYPAAQIADKKLYDPDGHWWGVVLASFGIVYNRDVLEDKGIKEPVTWADLADPKYSRWVALGDPSHSGSVRVTYDAILQHYGFERGLKTLRCCFANARYFTSHGSRVPVDVSSGEAMAGMCIDFYGRNQAEAVGGGKRVGYVAPAGATVITADPVAVLRGAKHKELAIRFVKFLISERGQKFWNLPVGAEDGPVKFNLRRMPIRRDAYLKYMDRMIDQVDPFEIARALPKDTPSYYSVVPTLLNAMAMDVHPELLRAWAAINRQTDSTLQKKMVAEFEKLPFADYKDMKKQRKALGEDEVRLKWMKFFKGQYEKVIELGAGG